MGDFWAFFSLAAGLSPPAAPVLAGELWFLIVLSVSTEIECSVYVSEEAKLRTGKPLEVTS
ncbi:hypothetical protein SLEP1_g49430 [Rubroshorea leprosula]|uniref:Uncharacterized protein n=1 Tax=Rubroshorea leprosula TaxID=152421 RepID=A0AAV5LWX8_9ROSI|nr:hypothetical protein SLEP1_g49430 [Rubroshorea leprosula]